jgi:hypothetical protein
MRWEDIKDLWQGGVLQQRWLDARKRFVDAKGAIVAPYDPGCCHRWGDSFQVDLKDAQAEALLLEAINDAARQAMEVFNDLNQPLIRPVRNWDAEDPWPGRILQFSDNGMTFIIREPIDREQRLVVLQWLFKVDSVPVSKSV